MRLLVIILIIGFLSAFIVVDYLFIIPKNWPTPEYDFSKNPLTPEKVFLGRNLFYDPLLSKNNKISCENCHSPYSAFTHIDHALSHGIYDSIGKRNSPALMNLAWKKTFMWDGAINHLDVQALAPISHVAEMGSSIKEVIDKLNHSAKYRKLFFKAFGDSLATGEKTLKSISQFLLTLVSSNAKYDKVKRHETTFTEQEENGYQLFKTNCSTCHQEPLFTNDEFANNGLALNNQLKDIGRMLVTKNKNDSLKFKVPTLRNIEYSYPYMHDGRFSKLSEVLNHYNSGINQSKTLAPQLKNGITLTANDKVDLINFLITLSDKEFVFNKKFQFPK